jgi:hypothetical protein
MQGLTCPLQDERERLTIDKRGFGNDSKTQEIKKRFVTVANFLFEWHLR